MEELKSGLTEHGMTALSDPESAGDNEVFRSTYKHWVGYQEGTCAMYLQRCIPPGCVGT